MARAEAKGVSRQAARGHRPAEHIVRKLGGVKQARLTGDLERVERGWLAGGLAAVKEALGDLADIIGIGKRAAPVPRKEPTIAPPRRRGGRRASPSFDEIVTGKRPERPDRAPGSSLSPVRSGPQPARPKPVKLRLSKASKDEAARREAEKRRDLERQRGGLTRADKGFIRRHARRAFEREHGQDGDPDEWLDYLQRAYDWADKSGMTAIRRRVAEQKDAYRQRRGEKNYVSGGPVIIDLMQLDDGDDGAPDEGWYFYHSS